MSPLVAGYNQWVAGRQVGPALPRPIADFLTGAFGPLQPLVPMPIDEPMKDVEGRPAPRRFQYPVGWNLPVGQPGTEGYKLASFQTLRRFADTYSILRAALNIRKEEMMGIEYDIGPTKEADELARGNKPAMQDLKARGKKALEFWARPDPNYYGFQSWLGAMLEEIFVIDALSLYLHPTRLDGKGPFGSNLASVEILSGDTIRPLLDLHGGIPRPPAPAFQQYLWGVPRSEMMDMIAERDILALAEDGVTTPEAEYSGDQLLYMPYTRRPWTPYGFSPVEQALLPITIGLNRQSFLLDFFTEGTIPGVYVIAGDQYVTPAQQRQLQDTLNALAGDQAWKHRVIVLPPGSKTDPQKDLSWQEQVDHTILEQVAMILHVQPHELGALPGGRSSGLGGKGVADQMQNSVTETRTLPMRMWLKRTLFDWVIQELWGQKDLEWKWLGFDSSDEDKKAERLKSEVEAGLRTIDEVRIENGLDPFDLPMTSKPFLMGPAPTPLDPEAAKALQDMQPEPPPMIGPDGKPIMGPDGQPISSGPKGQQPFAGKPPAVGPDGKPLPPGSGAAGPTASAGPPGAAFGAKPGKVPGKNGKNGSKPNPFAKKLSRGEKLTLADLVKGKVRYKGDITDIVHEYLLRSYPPKDVEWVNDKKGSWEFDPKVPLSRINMARRPGGRDPDKVTAIGDTLDAGASMDPIVLVDTGDNQLQIADGWHRTLGAEHAGVDSVPAFIGSGFGKVGPWTLEMQESSASKKSALAELATLRNFTRHGKAASAFVPKVLTTAEVALIGEEITAHGREQAFARARDRVEKDFTLSAPLDSGFVPFDLDGAPKCPKCDKDLVDGICPDHGAATKAAGFLGLLAKFDPANLLKMVDAELARRSLN